MAIRECERELLPTGRWRYVEVTKPDPKAINVRVEFPAIREGDTVAQIAATVEAGTLGNRGGQVVGIDEKAMVKKLYTLLDIDGGDELADEQYPEREYDPDRTKEVIPPPIPKLMPQGGVQPAPDAAGKQPAKEALEAAAHRLTRALELMEAEREDDEGSEIPTFDPTGHPIFDGSGDDNARKIIGMREYSADQERVPAGSPEGGEFAGGADGPSGTKGHLMGPYDTHAQAMRANVQVNQRGEYAGEKFKTIDGELRVTTGAKVEKSAEGQYFAKVTSRAPSTAEIERHVTGTLKTRADNALKVVRGNWNASNPDVKAYKSAVSDLAAAAPHSTDPIIQQHFANLKNL